MPNQPTRILFVCLGNICRSPLAEALFTSRAEERGVREIFDVDSAGISDYHAGDPPDARSVESALRRGIELSGRSRPVGPDDLRSFDLVIAMDVENLEALEGLRAAAGGEAEVRRLREWDPDAGEDDLDVPDPYFGGPRGFETVHEIVDRSCEALLEDLLSRAVSR